MAFSSTRREGFLAGALALLPLLIVGAAFILPYASALSAGGGGLAALRGDAGAPEGMGIPFVLPTAVFTVKQAALSTLAALVLGLPGAWFLGSIDSSSGGSSGGGGKIRRRGAALLRALTGIPFAMPPILVVLGFVLFFGNAGWANRLITALSGAKEGPIRILYKPWAIVLAHGFYNFPLVIRLAGDGIARIRRNYAPAAATLGASELKTALTVLFPMAAPSVLAAALLVFLYSFTSFAIVLVLGGGPAATTLAVEIYRYARITLNYSRAGVLALLETAIAGVVFLAYLFFERKSRALTGMGNAPIAMENRGASRRGKLFAVFYGLVLCFLVLGPLLSVPLESFLYRPSRSAPPALSLRWWFPFGTFAGAPFSFAKQVLPALGRSLGLALLAASLACLLGILAAGAMLSAPSAGKGGKRPFLGSLVSLWVISPLASSGIVLGLGWISLYGRERVRSLFAVAALHAVTALPFVFRSLMEGLHSLPENTLNAAGVFGAGPVKRLITVALPLSLRRLRSAWGFAAVISLGELNALLILGMEEWETLPLLIYRAAGAYRYGIACTGGTLLMASCMAFLLLSELKAPRSNHGP